jgi:hypothetical protein
MGDIQLSEPETERSENALAGRPAQQIHLPKNAIVQIVQKAD